MQKVVKEKILLITFGFSTSISSVHQTVYTRLYEVKRYQMGSNLVVLDQAGPNWAKQGQMGPDGIKWVQTGQMGPNKAKRSQTRANAGKRGQTRAKAGKRGKTQQNGAKRGQTGPNKAKRGQTGLIFCMDAYLNERKKCFATKLFRQKLDELWEFCRFQDFDWLH